MFPNGSIRSSHYVKHPQGSKHDSDIKRLEGAHKQHLDLGMNTEPEHQSHNPNQDNYEHNHGPIVSPTIGSESPALDGVERGTAKPL
jgi:hypothetical protein